MTAVDEAILALADKPEGYVIGVLLGRTVKHVDYRCRLLEQQGKLFKVKLSWRTVIWVTSQERADQMARDRRVPPPPPKPAPVDAGPGPAKLPGEMVITSRTRITMCPGFVPRFQGLGAVEFGLQRGRVYTSPTEGGGLTA